MQKQIACGLVLFVLLIYATVRDLTTDRIDNRLILSGLCLGTGMRLLTEGPTCLVAVFGNILFPVVVLYLFYLVGALGAGDIKLFSLIGSFVQFKTLVIAMGVSLVCGAMEALVFLACQNSVFRGLKWGFSYLTGLLHGQKPIAARDSKARGRGIHFTVPILIGTVASVLAEILF